MPGISQETVLLFKAQAEQFFSTLKRMEKELDGLKKKGSQTDPLSAMKKDAMRSFKEMDRYYGLMGDSAGGVTEKMNYLKTAMRQLSKDGSASSMKLAGSFKNVYDTLAKSGGKGEQFARIFDSMFGGKISQASALLKPLGINLGAVAGAAGAVGAGVIAMGLAWKNVLAPGIAFNAMLEQQEVGFRVMLGSATAAASMMGELKQLALTTPIGFEEGAQSTKQLFAYGFAQDEIISNMKMLGTLASATGTTVGDLTYVYGTLRAQGQAYTRDLMQFGMRGIPIYEYLATTLGVAVRDIKKLTEEGKIGFKEVEAAIKAMTGEGGRFNNMLEEQMKTLKGQQILLKNTTKLMQGEVAEAWSGVAKGFTASTTKLVTALGPIIGTVSDLFALMAKFLKPIYDTIVIIIQAISIVFESVRALIRVVNNALAPAVDAIKKFFGGWLDPLGKITAFLDKALKKIKEIGRATSEAPMEYAKYKSFDPDNILAQSAMWKAQEELQMMGKQIGGRGATFMADEKVQKGWEEAIGRYQAAMIAANGNATYSFEETLRGLAGIAERTGFKISKELYDALLSRGDELGVSFWERFKRIGKEGSFGGLEGFYEKGEAAAKAYTKQWEDAIASIQSSHSYSAEEMTEETKKVAKEAYEALKAGLYDYQQEYGDPTKYVGQERIFYDMLLAMKQRYEALSGDAAKKTAETTAEAMKKAEPDFSAYLQFRADAMNAETAQFQLSLMFATNQGDLLESYETQYGVVQMINDEYRRAWVALKYNYDQQVASLDEEYSKYDLTLEENAELKKEYELRKKILGLMLEENDAALILKTGQDLYNEQLEGSAEHWKQLQSDMGYAAERGDYNAYAGMAAVNATQGTEVGSLLAGGDPITMFITAFMEMIVSIENVAKALNPFKTALEGTKAIIEGPLNKALQPLVDALTAVGETIGVILLPIIDLMADAFGALFGWIKPLLKIFMALYQALSPLIKLFFMLINPIAFLFEILNNLFTAIGMIVDATMGQAEDLEDLYDRQVKALQDLYQVGAISGRQYEDELAKLKRGEQSPVESFLSNELNTSFTHLMEAIAEMSVAVSSLVSALLDVMWPVIQPALGLLAMVLNLVADTMSIVVGFLSGLANTFTALVNFFSGKMSWTDAVGAMANGWTAFKTGLVGFINTIIKGINWLTVWPVGDLAYVPYFDKGTDELAQDTIANVHKGEMIVPSDFATAIRNGDLALSGPGGGSAGTVININVGGNIVTERDFYKSVGTELTKLRRQGYA